MARITRHITRPTPRSIAHATVFGVACALAWAARAQAQEANTTITIVGRGLHAASVTGFGHMALEVTPIQAAVFDPTLLADTGVRTVGDLTRLDASLGEAYNAEGYWGMLSARGYTLDNRFNYRRDGLPINAETAIALDNKDRIELLKGTSGIQAGTSAPGGLVNLVVKRPTASLRSLRLETRQPGSLLAAVDLAERFGREAQWGVRVNAAYERLDAQARHTQGERWMAAMAADWQLSADTLLQVEFESSQQRQPSVAGFSLLGDGVPAAAGIDPRINLNDQAWRQPVEMAGDTASLRLRQSLAGGWQLTVHAMQQRLRSDDRTAFPYGVYDADYNCPKWCDRYAPDGSFTYWEYISDNERRTSSALSFALAGSARLAGVLHDVETGVLLTRYRGRFQDQVFDIAGTGHISGNVQTPRSAGYGDANTQRDERSSELFARDTVALGEAWRLWAGLRHTRLDRSSQRSSPAADGLRATHHAQSATLPWLALSRPWSSTTLLYASWGQGLESDVAPNRARYVNAGQALPALKSRQFEAGAKYGTGATQATLAFFDISRPVAADLGRCSAADSCVRAIDGAARHRGVEAAASWQGARWAWHASAMALDAKRTGSSQPGVNGTRPVNVPAGSLRLGAEYAPATMAGVALQADLRAETERHVLPYDASVVVPGWSRLDLGLRWRQALGDATLMWRLGLENATDRRAWKESPYQFGHSYLYPLAPRTWRASLQITR